MREINNKRAKSYKSTLPKQPGSSKYPESKKKQDCLYIDGEIFLATRGVFKVLLDNNLECVASARRMEQLRVSLLVGDRVTCEIPALALSPDEKIRGRVVWRYKTT